MKILNFTVILLSFVVSFYLFSSLPAQIPMHWNLQGQIDNYAPKSTAVWFIPVLTMAIFLLFQFLPHFDPHKENYRFFKKEWQIIQTGFIVFMSYLQFIILHASLNPSSNISPLIITGIGALFILIGLCLPKIKQNYFIGIKLPWTLANEENWNLTHRFAGKCFILSGILFSATAIFVPSAPFVILAIILLTVVLPTIYSFLVFKKMGL